MTPQEYQDWLLTKNQTSQPRVLLGEGYEWDAADYAQIPLALLVGSLNALPKASFGFRCSKNTTSARTALLEAFNYFDNNATFEGV
jgi:hypothetical protein